MLDKDNIHKFQKKIEFLFDALERHGIVCLADWTCCGTCGHAEIGSELKNEDDSYVFYHNQMAEDLNRGDDVLYLAHNIEEKDLPAVLEIVKSFGSDWDGSSNTAICVPYVDWTPEELEERRRNEEERQKRMKEIESDRIKALLKDATAHKMNPSDVEDKVWTPEELEERRRYEEKRQKLVKKIEPDRLKALIEEATAHKDMEVKELH